MNFYEDYKGINMTKSKRQITIEHYKSSYITWETLLELIKDVPPECMDSLYLEAESEDSYYESDSSKTIAIRYKREETDEEQAKREKQEAADIKRWEAREKEQLRVLQEKYKTK